MKYRLLFCLVFVGISACGVAVADEGEGNPFIQTTKIAIYFCIMAGVVFLCQHLLRKQKFEKMRVSYSPECMKLIEWLREHEINASLTRAGTLKFDPVGAKVPKKIKQKLIEHRAELVKFLRELDGDKKP